MSIRARYLLSFLLILPLCGVTALAQQPSTGLQQRMSSTDFKAAGLDKLSPQELQNLDQWLNTHAKVTTKMVDSSGKPVFYGDKSKREKIHAHINGHFGGWSGSNEYTLDNGQIWKQVGSDVVQCMTSDNPLAKVKPSALGNWLMFVSGCNDTVHVKRIH